jgi:hypothetical protein
LGLEWTNLASEISIDFVLADTEWVPGSSASQFTFVAGNFEKVLVL